MRALTDGVGDRGECDGECECAWPSRQKNDQSRTGLYFRADLKFG
jgi:hypothetical protein